MTKGSKRRNFGQISKLPSGRFRARYADPDKRLTDNGEPIRHNAPVTFDARQDAEAWLVDERRLISSGEWTPPKSRQLARHNAPLTFGEYAPAWLANRVTKGRPIADRTRDHYQSLLDAYLLPTFDDIALIDITPEMVDRWYELTAVGKPTTRAHAYSLLRTILGTAVDRRIITQANPARIRGAGTTERARTMRPATIKELEVIAATVPERHQLMVLFGAWCALRFGELAALRRKDIDTKAGIIRVRRGVVRTKNGPIEKKPKTEASIRDVAIPPHLLPLVREHLLKHTQPGSEGLLFAGGDGKFLQPSTFYGRTAVLDKDGTVKRAGWGYYAARQAAGREDLPFHGLRHTGAVLAAQTGAGLKDLMNRLGHSTQGAALRYQHAAEARDMQIAQKLSELAGGVSQ